MGFICKTARRKGAAAVPCTATAYPTHRQECDSASAQLQREGGFALLQVKITAELQTDTENGQVSGRAISMASWALRGWQSATDDPEREVRLHSQETCHCCYVKSGHRTNSPV